MCSQSLRTLLRFTHVYLHAQTAVYTYLSNHGYLKLQGNPNTPIEAPCQYKDGAGSGISCPEMNIPKEIRSSVPDPLLSTIDCILGLTQLCRLSSPAALQVAWSCCREVGQYYIKSIENSKIAKHALPPWIFYEPDLSKCTNFGTQFIT